MKVLKFYASWCNPCKMLSTTLSRMEDLPVIEEIDIDEQSEKAIEFGIRGVPTMVMINEDGSEIKRVSDSTMTREKLAEWFNEQ